MFNRYTKFEVSTTTCNQDVKGNAKCKNSRFEPPFEFRGIRGNVHGSSVARWKSRGRLPISANWTFVASYHVWGTIRADIGRNRCLQGVGHFQLKFQEERGVQVADLSHENFRSSRVIRLWLSRLSSRFGAKSSRERKPKWLLGLLTGNPYCSVCMLGNIDNETMGSIY